MNKKEILTLLHHRDPYLLIDEVLSIDESHIICQKRLVGDEYFFRGHFPSAPILPGAMMQEMTTQSAGVLITKFYSPVENYDSNKTKGHALGVLKKINYAKYKGFAKPGDILRIEVILNERVENLFSFKASIILGDKTIMSNSFLLTNIEDKHIM